LTERDGNPKARRARSAVVVAFCLAASAAAYETDQLTNRHTVIADSTGILNARVNETIAGIAADWSGGHDEMAFVNAVFHAIGGHHWVDKLERWAMRSPDVEKLEIPRYGSILAGHPIWATRVTKLFGVGDTIRVNDEYIGSDKIGHFLSQGRKYYRRYRRSGSEAQAARRSAYTERALFGQLTTGAYSNADLVANYEGHRLYRSLFEDDIVPGKPAILRWRNGGWIVQREFDWADHVNAYWDEALNINHYDALLYKHMHRRFLEFCSRFRERPSLYAIKDEAPLRAKYQDLELRNTRELRLDSLCRVQIYLESQREGATTAGISLPGVRAFP
jgi:hypothetical protein